MSALIKDVTTTYIPGSPSNPGQPYIPPQPARSVWEPRTVCSWNYPVEVIQLEDGSYALMPGDSSYSCTTEMVLVYYPATAGQAAIPYAPPTPAQIVVSLNQGWNSYARSIEQLSISEYYEYTVKVGTYAALLAIGHAGMEGASIAAFPYGVMLDASGVYVFENGVVGPQLATSNAPGLIIRIARLADSRIVYRVGSVVHISETIAIDDFDEVFVYGLLYSGYDEVSYSAFVSGDMLRDEARVVMRGSGELLPLAQPRVVMYGDSALNVSISLGVVMPAVSSMDAELDAASMVDASLVGSSALVVSMNSPGRGSITLEPLRFLAGDYAFPGAGYTELPELQFSATEAVYVPVAPTAGYMNLPFLTAWGEGGTEDAGTGSFELPYLLTLAADTAYGVGYTALPQLLFSGSADWMADDEMVLVSSVLGTSAVIPAIDLILVLNSQGMLVSSMQLDRLMFMELLSYMEQMSTFAALGEYDMQLLSTVRSAMYATYSAAGRPDIDGDSAVWVLNLDTAGSTRYEQYGFNSFFERDGSYYGIASDGIYKLDGATDAGSPIEAVVHVGRTDLGYTNEKRIKDMYLGISSSGELYLKVDTDEQVYVYSMRTSGTAMRHRPVPVGWGVSGYYWDFTLVNPNGEDFKLESIEFTPIPLARRG